jgi:hypothetical protein
MKRLWAVPLGRAAGKYGEHVPMATACCNACRTCATTNLLAVAIAALGGAGLAISRLVKRGVSFGP